MIDRPPFEEASFAAFGALAVVLLVSRYGSQRDELIARWVVVAAVIVVLLGDASWSFLFFLVVASGASYIPGVQARVLITLGALVGSSLMLADGLGTWLQFGTLVGGLVAGLLAWDATQSNGQPLALILLAWTAFGIYINVPDTEQIAVHGAGLVVLVVASCLLTQLRGSVVPISPMLLLGVLLIGAGAVGARGRPDAFVAVLGALGAIVAEPVARRLRSPRLVHPAIVVVAHAIVVVITSRVAGRRDASTAALVVLVALASLVLVFVIAARRPVGDET